VEAMGNENYKAQICGEDSERSGRRGTGFELDDGWIVLETKVETDRVADFKTNAEYTRKLLGMARKS
jgi:hypothetical protein